MPAPAATSVEAQAATSGTATATGTLAPGGTTEPVAWDVLHRRYNSWYGSTGGIGVIDASTSVPGAVRIQLGLDFFSGSDYLYDDDEVDFRSQTLSLSITPLEVLELFGSLTNRSVSEEGEGPLDSFGDFMFGLKVAGHLAPALWLGGELRAQLGGEEGGSGQAWDSTSVGLRALFTVDLNELEKPVPFVARVNVGYWFDSSANIVDEEESSRYENLDDPAPRDDETQHLVSRFERLAFGINRFDKLTLGVGFELPLQLAENFFLHPMAEWQMGIPVNRQDYDCPYFREDSNSGKPSTPNDSCFERHAGTAPMNLLFGVRVVPPLRGLSILIGADIGLTGTDRFVRELAPNLPYRVLVAVSYDYDARPVPEKIVTVAAPLQPSAAPAVVVPTGRIRGVVASTDGTAVAGATVSFPELQVTALSTGADGSFVTEAFAAGIVNISVTHPDYDNGVCPASIPTAGGDVGVRCVLTPKPRQGAVAGRVLDAWGAPIPGARVVLTGPGGTLVNTDAQGAFSAPNLAPGEYNVRVEASGFFVRQSKATVAPRETARFEWNLTRKPLKPSITLMPDSSVEAPAIAWVGETSVDLTPAAEAAVAELAELLTSRPDLSVRIQGPGSELVARPRAEVIKQRLVAMGIEAHRIEALGGGKRLRISLRP